MPGNPVQAALVETTDDAVRSRNPRMNGSLLFRQKPEEKTLVMGTPLHSGQ